LEAFAKVRQTIDARLVILGEGSLRAELEERIHHLELQDVVDMPGFQPNPFGWMGACSVYVLSSRYEGFPTSLLQAMACGAKIVSTDCPTGPVEILEDGKWGRLVPVGDADALAKEIVAALATPPFSAQEESVYRFSLQRILKSYAAVLSI
jgi:Glycosyltransferase